MIHGNRTGWLPLSATVLLAAGCPARKPAPLIIPNAGNDQGVRLRLPFPCGTAVRISCTYGPRCSPAHRGREFYAVDMRRARPDSGQDMAVVAAAPGRVRHAGWARRGLRPYGKLVVIEHRFRDGRGRVYMTVYAHLHRVVARVGQQVQAGTVIGTLGGSSSGDLHRLGPHLHFVLMRGRRPSLAGARSVRPEPMGHYPRLHMGMRLVACGRPEPPAVTLASVE